MPSHTWWQCSGVAAQKTSPAHARPTHAGAFLGLVVSFRVALFPVARAVPSISAVYPLAAARDVVALHARLCANAPKRVEASVAFVHGAEPPHAPCVVLGATSLLPPAQDDGDGGDGAGCGQADPQARQAVQEAYDLVRGGGWGCWALNSGYVSWLVAACGSACRSCCAGRAGMGRHSRSRLPLLRLLTLARMSRAGGWGPHAPQQPTREQQTRKLYTARTEAHLVACLAPAPCTHPGARAGARVTAGAAGRRPALPGRSHRAGRRLGVARPVPVGGRCTVLLWQWHDS